MDEVIPTTVLILGGTGNFGARICRRLAGEPGVRMLISGRNRDTLEPFVAEINALSPSCPATAVVLNHQAEDFPARLAELKPALVIHTAGPFQGQDYRVAEACLACGSHYIDLADGRTFVEGFAAHLHKRAEERGLLLIAGASTLPGLSSAVIRELTEDWSELREIEISIAPAQQTPRGLSTIAAVLSYCGKPFKVLIDGEWRSRYGWQNLKVQRYPQLGTRLSAVCDVPDLTLFPQRYAALKSVQFHAALESRIEHLTLWCFAGLTRLGLVKEWVRHAERFQGLGRISQRLGSDVGGMHVRVRGRDAKGLPVSRRWDLVARNNHGPEIPVSPALALARKFVRGQLPLRGAHPCYQLMSLTEFDEEVSALDIGWSIAEHSGS